MLQTGRLDRFQSRWSYQRVLGSAELPINAFNGEIPFKQPT